MKKILLVALALCSLAVLVLGAGDSERKAIARILYGRIFVVGRGDVSDYRVREVDHGEDLRVRVGNFANSPGRWRFVERGDVCDYRIQFVDSGEDIRVRFVDFGEGPR